MEKQVAEPATGRTRLRMAATYEGHWARERADVTLSSVGGEELSPARFSLEGQDISLHPKPRQTWAGMAGNAGG